MAKVTCCLCGNVATSFSMFRIVDGYICFNCVTKRLGADTKILEKFFGKPEKMWTSEMLKGLEKEKRKKCNVCGQIFCYREVDIVRAMRQADLARASLMAGMAHAISGSAAAAATYQGNAIRQLNATDDVNQCPNCHSSDCHILTDEEWAEEQKKASAPESAPVSAADELKKFKELLDMGVITQEEFDAKKKQLLGL